MDRNFDAGERVEHRYTPGSESGAPVSVDELVAVLAGVTAVSALATIAFDVKGQWRGVYIFKPLTMVAVLITWALVWPAGTPKMLVGAGLAASLVGDILLMLRRERFIAGLVAFLIAHAFYICAFASIVLASGSPVVAWSTLAGLLVFGAVWLWYFWSSLDELRIPIVIYLGIIVTMAVAAASAWESGGSWRLVAGSLLFVASDTMLATNRFGARIPLSPLWVLGSYFAAQWFIATAG